MPKHVSYFHYLGLLTMNNVCAVHLCLWLNTRVSFGGKKRWNWSNHSPETCHAKYSLWGWCFIVFIVFTYVVWALRTDTEWIFPFRFVLGYKLWYLTWMSDVLCDRLIDRTGLQIVGMLETKSSSPCTSINLAKTKISDTQTPRTNQRSSTEVSSTGSNPANNLTSLLPVAALTVNQDVENRSTLWHVTAGKAPVGIKIKRWLNSV